MIWFVIGLILTGALTGLLAGSLGVGGGVLLVPGLFFILERHTDNTDRLMQVCLATSLSVVLFNSLVSLWSHHQHRMIKWHILFRFAPWVMIGSFSGMILTPYLRSDVLIYIFSGFSGLLAFFMISRMNWKPRHTELPKGRTRMGLGYATGFLSSLIGFGGGAPATIIMTIYGVPIHHAVATASGFGFLVAFPATMGFLLTPVPEALMREHMIGSIHALSALILFLSASVTTPIGASIAHRVNAARLRQFFGFFLFALALSMALKAIYLVN